MSHETSASESREIIKIQLPKYVKCAENILKNVRDKKCNIKNIPNPGGTLEKTHTRAHTLAKKIFKHRKVIRNVIKKMQLHKEEPFMSQERAEIIIYKMAVKDSTLLGNNSKPFLTMEKFREEIKFFSFKRQNKNIVDSNILAVKNLQSKKKDVQKIKNQISTNSMHKKILLEKRIKKPILFVPQEKASVGNKGKAKKKRVSKIVKVPVQDNGQKKPDALVQDSCTLRLKVSPKLKLSNGAQNGNRSAVKSNVCLKATIVKQLKMSWKKKKITATTAKQPLMSREEKKIYGEEAISRKRFMEKTPICCPKILINTFQLPFRKGEEFVPIYLRSDCITFRLPVPSDTTKMITLELEASDIRSVIIVLKMPMLLVYISPSCANRLQNLLRLPKQDDDSAFDGNDQKIIFFVHNWTTQHCQFMQYDTLWYRKDNREKAMRKILSQKRGLRILSKKKKPEEKIVKKTKLMNMSESMNNAHEYSSFDNTNEEETKKEEENEKRKLMAISESMNNSHEYSLFDNTNKVSSNVKVTAQDNGSDSPKMLCEFEDPAVTLGKADDSWTLRLSESPEAKKDIAMKDSPEVKVESVMEEIPDAITQDSCMLSLSVSPKVEISKEAEDQHIYDISDVYGTPTVAKRRKKQKLKNWSITICCTEILIDCLKLPLCKGEAIVPVCLSRKSLEFQVPNLCNSAEMVAVELKSSDICSIVASFDNDLPIMFVYISPSCADRLRNLLQLPKQESVSNLDGDEQMLTFFVKSWTKKHRKILLVRFPWYKKTKEMDLGDAKEILFRTIPSELAGDEQKLAGGEQKLKDDEQELAGVVQKLKFFVESLAKNHREVLLEHFPWYKVTKTNGSQECKGNSFRNNTK